MGISASIMNYLHMSVVKLSVQSAKVIPVMDWPPYSPDLNPIEMVWGWLKDWITTNHPELIDMGDNEDAYQALYAAMKEGWESIPQEKIDNLIKGMDRRLEACRLAKGWHTKY